jgi:hypothetical protein
VLISIDGEVWRSIGGKSWAKVARLTFPNGNSDFVSNVVYANGRFIATGILGTQGGAAATMVAFYPIGGVIWTSRDGVTWTIRKPQGLTTTGPVVLSALLPSDDSLWAVEQTVAAGPVAIVSTRDGMLWTIEAELKGQNEYDVSDIGLLGDGSHAMFTAVEDETCSGPAVSIGVIGRDRKIGLVSDQHLCGFLSGVRSGPSGYVATLQVNDQTRLARSSDGRSWTVIETPLVGPWNALGVTASGSYLVPDSTGVWESANLEDWAKSIDRPTTPATNMSFAGDFLIWCEGYYECDRYQLKG